MAKNMGGGMRYTDTTERVKGAMPKMSGSMPPAKKSVQHASGHGMKGSVSRNPAKGKCEVG